MENKNIEKLRKEIEQEKKYLKMQSDACEEKKTEKQLKKELLMLRMKRQNPKLVKAGSWLSKAGKVAGKGLGKLADNLEKSAKIEAELQKKRKAKQKPYSDPQLEKLMFGK